MLLAVNAWRNVFAVVFVLVFAISTANTSSKNTEMQWKLTNLQTVEQGTANLSICVKVSLLSCKTL